MSNPTTEHVVDKSTWAKGEWTDEPDHLAFEHRGVPCIIPASSRTAASVATRRSLRGIRGTGRR
jgi:hypothetical protein